MIADAGFSPSATGSAPNKITLLGRRTLLVLFLVALAVRITYCLTLLRHYEVISDASDYYKIAISVAHGDGFATTFPFAWVHPTAFRPPLYPILLGGVFAVTGPSLAVAEAVNIVLGSTVVVLVGITAARFAGRRAGLVAGGLAAFYSPLIANDGPPLTEPLALVLFLSGLLALLSRRFRLAGLFVGLLVLSRPSAQLLVPVLALWLLIRVDWRRAAVFSVIVGVVVLPWVVRNEVVLGKPLLVTSNGFNVAATWSPEALELNRPVDPVYEERFAPLHLGRASYNEAVMDANLRKVGVQGLRSHPHRVPSVLWRNTRFLLDFHHSLHSPAEHLDGRNTNLRYWSLPMVWLVEAVGLVGLLRLRRRPGGGLLLLLGTYYLLISAIAVAPPRLRAPIDVLLLIGVGSAVAMLLDWLQARRPVAVTGLNATEARPMSGIS